jgi:hypothetical protein
MPSRRKLDDPGVMDAILNGIDERPREYWIAMIERYENEKPGDIILPGVPLDRIRRPEAVPSSEPKKKAPRKNRAA